LIVGKPPHVASRNEGPRRMRWEKLGAAREKAREGPGGGIVIRPAPSTSRLARRADGYVSCGRAFVEERSHVASRSRGTAKLRRKHGAKRAAPPL
jgi:hypothetical protein